MSFDLLAFNLEWFESLNTTFKPLTCTCIDYSSIRGVA